MSPIELIICLLLLLFLIPDICERLGRPSLVYTVYLVLGLFVGRFVEPPVSVLLAELGKIGFILLLFEIGLEIDLPPVHHWWTPLKLVAKWTAVQYPVVLLLAYSTGLGLKECVLCAVALNGCSLSMTFLPWLHFPAPSQENKKHLLLWMVSLEIFAIVFLTAGSALIKHGFGTSFQIQLALIALAVVAISLSANGLAGLLGKYVLSTRHWRIHYITLFVFAMAALGERLGLGGAKTVFFVGLFVSRATHEGIALSHHLRPITQRLLIPVFFISLGAAVPLDLIATRLALVALGSAAILLLLRDVLHRTIARSGCGRRAALLVTPNVTITAIAAGMMIEAGSPRNAVAWLLLTSVFMSVASLMLLPRTPRPVEGKEPAPDAGSA